VKYSLGGDLGGDGLGGGICGLDGMAGVGGDVLGGRRRERSRGGSGWDSGLYMVVRERLREDLRTSDGLSVVIFIRGGRAYVAMDFHQVVRAIVRLLELSFSDRRLLGW